MVSSAFYWHEIECEIMERSLDWSFKGKLEDARDEFMKFIESKRRTENYAHPVKDCSQMCKERGNIYKLTYFGLDLQPYGCACLLITHAVQEKFIAKLVNSKVNFTRKIDIVLMAS